VLQVGCHVPQHYSYGGSRGECTTFVLLRPVAICLAVYTYLLNIIAAAAVMMQQPVGVANSSLSTHDTPNALRHALQVLGLPAAMSHLGWIWGSIFMLFSYWVRWVFVS